MIMRPLELSSLSLKVQEPEFPSLFVSSFLSIMGYWAPHVVEIVKNFEPIRSSNLMNMCLFPGQTSKDLYKK